MFELAFADAKARIAERRRLARSAFAKVFDNRAPLRTVMEACSSPIIGRVRSSGAAMQ